MDMDQLEQLGLEKITAFIPADGKPVKRSKSAERMQKMRERKKEQGLVSVELRAEQAASLEGDLELARKVKALRGLKKMAVMRLLA